jgi:hypothetical protein
MYANSAFISISTSNTQGWYLAAAAGLMRPPYHADHFQIDQNKFQQLPRHKRAEEARTGRG